ncbi:hypothetical protein [Brevibacillus dissolubilis]|uniref:hypothetical protein n=1 Tax=Brevibacillus dissolubilis TaxID=1844116 RepID=UPI00159BAB37|nr:hypothetical protein [Brevibacillus dissolubilis]
MLVMSVLASLVFLVFSGGIAYAVYRGIEADTLDHDKKYVWVDADLSFLNDKKK